MLPASAFNNTPKFPCAFCNTQLQHSTTLPSFLVVHSATHSFSIQQHSQVSLLYILQHTASAFNNTPQFPCTFCNTQLQHSTTLPSFLVVHHATHSFSIQQHSQVSLLYTMQHTASAFNNTPKFPCCTPCNTQLQHSTTLPSFLVVHHATHSFSIQQHSQVSLLCILQHTA